MSKTNQKDSIKNSNAKEKYNYDEDRMVGEGLAGGEVDSHYEHPSVDHARPVKKEKKPKDT